MPDKEFLTATEYLTVEVNEKLSTLKEDENFIYVSGIALTATNIPRYYGILHIPEEELQKATPTVIGKPFLKDHDNTIDSVIGRIENAAYNNGVLIEAKIIKKGNEALIEKIKAGIVKKLSAGFKRDLEFDQDKGHYKAKNIEFLEVSLVWEGADKNATLLKEDLNMATIEQLSKEKAQLEEKLGKLEAEKEELKKENEILKKEIERLKELAELGQKYKEQLKAEVRKYIKIVEGDKAEKLLKIVDKSDLEDLEAFKETYEPKAKELLQNRAEEVEDIEQFKDIEQGKQKLDLDKMSLEDLLKLEEQFRREVN